MPKTRFAKIRPAVPKAQLGWAAVVALFFRGEDFATSHAARPGLPFGQGKGYPRNPTAVGRKPTVGIEFAVAYVPHPNGSRIKAQIWDTGTKPTASRTELRLC